MSKWLNLKIIIPSKGRAGEILTLENVLKPEIVTIVVPPEDEEEYRAKHSDSEIYVLPKNVQGLSNVRQHILDTFNEEFDVFMIDDDVKQVRRLWMESGEPVVLEPETFMDYIRNGADIAKQMGCKLWGFDSLRRPVQYPSHQPFRFTGYWNASYIGFLRGFDVRFSPEFVECDDYYLSCAYILKHRYGFQDRRLAIITQDNFKRSGGLSNVRTIEMMKRGTLGLRKLFGECVKPKGITTIRQNVNEGERSIGIPF